MLGFMSASVELGSTSGSVAKREEYGENFGGSEIWDKY
jgi:hypothetical protein